MNQGSKVKSNNKSNTEKTTLHYDDCMSINAFLCPCSLGFPAHDIVFIFFTFGLTSRLRLPHGVNPTFLLLTHNQGVNPCHELLFMFFSLTNGMWQV